MIPVIIAFLISLQLPCPPRCATPHTPPHENTHTGALVAVDVGGVFAGGDEIMFDHKAYQNQFLQDYREGKFQNLGRAGSLG